MLKNGEFNVYQLLNLHLGAVIHRTFPDPWLLMMQVFLILAVAHEVLDVNAPLIFRANEAIAAWIDDRWIELRRLIAFPKDPR